MSSATRRVPRRIEKDDEPISQNDGLASQGDGPVVKRPASSSRTFMKPNKSSKLRTSFASLQLPEDDVNEPTNTFKPHSFRRLSQRIEHIRTASSDRLHSGSRLTDHRPTYNAGDLSNLNNATASSISPTTEYRTPISNDILAPQDLEIGSKFGNPGLELATGSEITVSRIPSESEIREKKERRKRLANEQNYISLSDMDADGREDFREGDSEDEHRFSHSLVIPADEGFVASKYGETRLVHEDDDMAEGFEEFVEDTGQVALSWKASREQERQRRKEIEDQIRTAQHGHGNASRKESPEEGDFDHDDDLKRSAAYDAVQTRAGTYGMGKGNKKKIGGEQRLEKRLEVPKVEAVPEFKAVISRFFSVVSVKEHEIEEIQKKLAKLQQEQVEVVDEAARVQNLLDEAGRRYESLKVETTQDPLKL